MFSFVCIRRDQRGKRERGSNAIYLLSCLLCSFSAVAFFLFLFTCFSSPPDIFFFFLLFRPCNSQLFPFTSTEVVSLVAVLAFLHLSFFRAPPWRFLF